MEWISVFFLGNQFDFMDKKSSDFVISRVLRNALRSKIPFSFSGSKSKSPAAHTLLEGYTNTEQSVTHQQFLCQWDCRKPAKISSQASLRYSKIHWMDSLRWLHLKETFCQKNLKNGIAQTCFTYHASANWNYTAASCMSFKTKIAGIKPFTCLLLLMEQLELL